MKILVEGSPIFRNRSGVGQYVYRLLGKLLEIDKDNNYFIYGFLFAGKKFNPPYKKLPKNARYNLIRLLPLKINNVLSRRLFVPPIDVLSGIKADLTIFTNFVRTPLPLGSKSITIIYDLSFITYRQFSNDKLAKFLTKQTAIAARKSDMIITISKNSKREIVEHYGVDPSKIEIVHPALDHAVYYPRSIKEQETVAKKFGINNSYILYTGTIEPRKNIIGIIEAYSKLTDEVKNQYMLVLAGGKGWKDEEIKRCLAKHSDENIILTGYVDDKDLPALYSGASLFVYPSFYEGFGMPPLEAMACGVPVIASNNSSLPEVIGDAGIMVDAHDTVDLSRQMKRVLTDNKLAKDLKKKGILQAQCFDWKNSAKNLKQIINSYKKGAS